MGIDADIAKNMSMALVGELPLGANVFGAMIIDAVFPSPDEVPGYFQEVYAQITKIVQQALTENEVNLIEGQVIGIQNWISTTYSQIREDKSRTALERFAAVAPYEAEFNKKVMGTLMQGSYAMPGLPMFMTAASMHLALKQELALNDYRHQDRPADSPYADAVSATARLYADFAVATWTRLQAARRASVKPTIKHSTQQTAVPRGDPVVRHIWSYNWRDEGVDPILEGKKHSEGNNDWNCQSGRQSAAEAEAYRDQVVSRLDAELGSVSSIVGEWTKLIEQPLGMPFKAKLLFARALVVGNYYGRPIYHLYWATEDAMEVVFGNDVHAPSGDAVLYTSLATPLDAPLEPLIVVDHLKARRAFAWEKI